MKNCVTGYAEKVVLGKSYIYQVILPERATLELRTRKNGQWYIAQLEQADNEPASPHTYLFVQQWLEEYLPAQKKR